MTRIPKFLQIQDGRTVGTRPKLDIDDITENGTALDVVRKRPLYRTKLIKKLRRQIAELEELKAFVDSKGDRNLSKEELENIFKD